MQKIIHQFWHSNNIPEDYLNYSAVLKSNNPDYCHILWNERSARSSVEDIITEYRIPYDDYMYDVERWDVLTFAIIYKYGGVYCDLDTKCINSISALVKPPCGFLCDSNVGPCNIQYIHHPFFYAEKYNEFIKSILKNFKRYSKTDTLGADRVSNTVGPTMLTSVFAKYIDKNNVNLIPLEKMNKYLIHLNACGWK